MTNNLKYIFILLFGFASSVAFASEGNLMEETFFASGKVYVTVTIISVILVGMFIYLFRMDRRISKMEQEIKH